MRFKQIYHWIQESGRPSKKEMVKYFLDFLTFYEEEDPSLACEEDSYDQKYFPPNTLSSHSCEKNHWTSP
jgi:hypothetical protein